MRVLGAILLLAFALGAFHAHEGCLDEPCLKCHGGDQANLLPAPQLDVDLRSDGLATCLEPAAPTTARTRRDSARAPPASR